MPGARDRRGDTRRPQAHRRDTRRDRRGHGRRPFRAFWRVKMKYEDVIVARTEQWLEIAINRPEKLNSLRDKTAEEILHALGEAEHDRNIRAVILLGQEKAFCTGIDTSEFQIKENGYFDFYRFRKRTRPVNRLFRELPAFTKPLIIAVEGYAL